MPARDVRSCVRCRWSLHDRTSLVCGVSCSQAQGSLGSQPKGWGNQPQLGLKPSSALETRFPLVLELKEKGLGSFKVGDHIDKEILCVSLKLIKNMKETFFVQ